MPPTPPKLCVIASRQKLWVSNTFKAGLKQILYDSSDQQDGDDEKDDGNDSDEIGCYKRSFDVEERPQAK
jgi:hypothetical protein